MNRTTPLKRTKSLRKVSPKANAESKELAQKRAEWLRQHPWCVVALMKGQRGVPSTDVHEWVGGSFRQRTKSDPRFWLPVNRFNHPLIQYMPRARQVALQILFVPDSFDISSLSACPGFVLGTAEVLSEVHAVRKLSKV